MDGTSNGEHPTELHVYVDESVRELPDGRRLVGAGALIVLRRVGVDLIERALGTLEADPDRHDENRRKLDERTLRRRHFHASADSVNARSALSKEIRAHVKGKFECSFAEARTRRTVHLQSALWSNLQDSPAESRRSLGEDPALEPAARIGRHVVRGSRSLWPSRGGPLGGERHALNLLDHILQDDGRAGTSLEKKA
jgi:hypothetical protein